MKKTLLLLSAVSLFFMACGGSSSDESSTASTETPPPVAAKPAMEPGELLIVKSDCIGCHHKEDKLIGPAYQEIAAKYPNTPETVTALAGKIMKGSKGTWGPVPMTPHLKISSDDAQLMVKYILSLKK